MCDFPSWIIDADDKPWWLTDKDVERFHGESSEKIIWYDFVGHHGLRKVFGVFGEDREGFDSLPSQLVTDIRNNKLRKLMAAGGYKSVIINNEGMLHCNNGPAIEYTDGTKYWHLDGKLHREDGPAIECARGTKYWHLDGKLHRENGPAVERTDGTKHWYLNGERHREYGPAIECANGAKYWYLNGERTNKPTI